MIEPESLCYSGNSYNRRAKVWVNDALTGKRMLRIVRCKLPDSFSSVPAKLDRVKGFVSIESGEFTFTPCAL